MQSGDAQKMENKQLASPSRKCSSTPVGFHEGFLSKEQAEKHKHPPYPPDLVPADFYLFCLLKSAPK
jgi:hypothetical protein